MGEGIVARRASFWHALGGQLAHPRGLGGALVGHVMALANRHPTRLVVDALEAGPEDAVLDIGCGPGHALARIAPSCREAHGIDRSEVMIRQARRRNRRRIASGQVALAVGDFTDLPYPAARFDRIMASNVIYFWNDLGAVLAELRRVLRPGGRIVIYATERTSMQSWPFATGGSHRIFGVDEFTRMLNAESVRYSAEVRTPVLPGGVKGLIGILEDREALAE
jgi:ubiquinone/menaquinone biosynthesis C-methylase UbiE